MTDKRKNMIKKTLKFTDKEFKENIKSILECESLLHNSNPQTVKEAEELKQIFERSNEHIILCKRQLLRILNRLECKS